MKREPQKFQADLENLINYFGQDLNILNNYWKKKNSLNIRKWP